MIGFLLGMALATGVLVLLGVVRGARTSAPLARARAQLGVDPVVGAGGWRAWLAPTLHPLAQRLHRGDEAALAARLTRAGRSEDPADFRIGQVGWACVGAAAAAGVAILMSILGSPPSSLPSAVLICGGAAAGHALPDWWLGRVIRSRSAQVRAELPALADLLAFSLSAGLSPAAAVERLAARSRGLLGAQLARCSDDMRGGMAFLPALVATAQRIDVPDFNRFTDGVVLAVERGSPVADVLTAQAGDIRATAHRRLLEAAGRKEVAMLVPIVFLVLPTVVLIALLPAAAGVTLIVP